MTKTKSKPEPSIEPYAIRYQFIEVTAAASHVGKTLTATFITALLRSVGIPVLLARIESKAARLTSTADLDIDSEDFGQAARLPGGEAAILRPVYDALQKAPQDKRVIIVDWAGGFVDYRNKILAATRFDERLADLGLQGISLVVTTSQADRMRQAADVLTHTRLITPQLDRAVVLNRRLGAFNFVPGSAERSAFDALQKAAEGDPAIRIPAVAGESWKSCENAGLSMREVIELNLPELAKRLSEDLWVASAVQVQVLAWWTAAEKEVLKVLGRKNGAG
jgi:hypothetical protein